MSTIQGYLDVVSKYGAVYPFSLHSVGSGGEISAADFESIVDYMVNTKGMQILSLPQWAMMQRAHW